MISVIIPTLNEAENLPRLLSVLQRDADAEIIIADGGSQDTTTRIARQNGCKVVTTLAASVRDNNFRIRIPPMIKNLSKQEKITLFSWAKEFWFETSLAMAKEYVSDIKCHDKLVIFWLKGRWRFQQKRLKNLGLASR